MAIKNCPTDKLTRAEVDALDNMMLRDIGLLRSLGATDAAAARCDMRLRLLALMDFIGTVEGR